MISITYVTITYNAAAVLQRTLDSVLQQDYPEITHLIIDGASTDGTLEMVNDYIERSNEADNGHRVQVTSEPDKGIYDAMNKGIRRATGDVIGMINSGDRYLPGALAKVASAFGETPGRRIFTLSSSARHRAIRRSERPPSR